MQLVLVFVFVFVFEYWDSKYRKGIALARGLAEADELKVPLFGDLRLLRQAIIHRRGVLGDNLRRRLSIISFPVGPDEPVYFMDENFESLIRRIVGTLDQIVVDAGLPDPSHRTRWISE